MCGLRELAQLALVGDAIASQLLTPEILSALLVCPSLFLKVIALYIRSGLSRQPVTCRCRWMMRCL